MSSIYYQGRNFGSLGLPCQSRCHNGASLTALEANRLLLNKDYKLPIFSALFKLDMKKSFSVSFLLSAFSKISESPPEVLPNK